MTRDTQGFSLGLFVKCSQALKFEYICTHTNRLKPFSFQNNKLHSFPLTPQNALPVCHYFVFELSTCKIHLKKCDCSEKPLPTYLRLGLHTHTLLDCAAEPTHDENTAHDALYVRHGPVLRVQRVQSPT